MTLPTLEQVTNYVAEAGTRPLEQYQDKPRLLALFLSYVRRCQELEDAAWDVIIKRMIDNAHDAQLDTIGKIVGQLRGSQGDWTYRVYITARIRINRSHGHPDDVIDVLQLIEATPFDYTEYYPASALLTYVNPPGTDPGTLLALAKLAVSAGVQLALIAAMGTTAPDVFAFSDVGSASDPRKAFTDSVVFPAGTGGVFASVYA